MEKVCYVIVAGDVLSGISIHGPFATEDDALEWGEKIREIDWHLAPLVTPWVH